MGLDAFVRCDCLETGRAADPPVPRDRLRLDDGLLFDAAAPACRRDETADERRVRHAAEDALAEWQRTACGHDDMRLVSLRVANWGAVFAFRHVLRGFGVGGEARFGALLAEVPSVNGGEVPAGRSAACLAELDAFDALPALGEKTVLRDAETGRVVRTRNDASPDRFWGNARPGLDVAPDERRLRLFDRVTGETAFASALFRQTVLPAEPGVRGAPPAEWADAATGATAVGRALGPRAAAGGGAAYAARLRVDREPRTSADFVGATTALRRLFAASVRTGGPVRWT